MLRGRHRGLPVAIDRAVLLKGDDFPDSISAEMQPQEKPGHVSQGDARGNGDFAESNEKRNDGASSHHTSHPYHLPLQHPLALRMHPASNGSAVLAEHLMSTPTREMTSFHRPSYTPPVQAPRAQDQDPDHLDPRLGGSPSSKETVVEQRVATP